MHQEGLPKALGVPGLVSTSSLTEDVHRSHGDWLEAFCTCLYAVCIHIQSASVDSVQLWNAIITVGVVGVLLLGHSFNEKSTISVNPACLLV